MQSVMETMNKTNDMILPKVNELSPLKPNNGKPSPKVGWLPPMTQQKNIISYSNSTLKSRNELNQLTILENYIANDHLMKANLN